jgi:hypothetical protein
MNGMVTRHSTTNVASAADVHSKPIYANRMPAPKCSSEASQTQGILSESRNDKSHPDGNRYKERK